MQKSSRSWLYVILLIALAPFIWSCGNVRQLQYFQGSFDTARLSQVTYPEPVIQKNDLISIAVYSDNPLASAYYNLPVQPVVNSTGVVNSTTPVSNTTGSVYLVDKDGNIPFPGLGKLQVAGLTKKQLDSVLHSRLADKLQNPYYIIRLASFTITMIGEVAKPGQFTIPNEKVSLLEALALSGDLTVFGRRDNVLVIREINGKREYARLDLRDPEIMGSPYFYLQPNDVVYVDVNKTKAAANDAVVVRNISIAVSIISVLAVVISLSQ